MPFDEKERSCLDPVAPRSQQAHHDSMADTPLPTDLFLRAQIALGMSQREIADLLEVSRSTIVRRTRGKTVPLYFDERSKLAQAVHHVEPALALEIAAALNETPQAMGIAPRPEPPKPEPLDDKLVPLLVDGVVCAAADVASQPPAAVREILRAAFGRAQAAGLGVDALVKGLGGRGKRKGVRTRGMPLRMPRNDPLHFHR
jgi:transcriptional regulator with XRE-family HTH domain